MRLKIHVVKEGLNSSQPGHTHHKWDGATISYFTFFLGQTVPKLVNGQQSGSEISPSDQTSPSPLAAFINQNCSQLSWGKQEHHLAHLVLFPK